MLTNDIVSFEQLDPVVKEEYLIIILEKIFSSSIKNYVDGTHYEHLDEGLLMSPNASHNVCFYEKISKISQKYHQICLLNPLKTE